jgi:hypothetical protein
MAKPPSAPGVKYLSFLCVCMIANLPTATASCPDTGLITAASGQLSGPSTYTANDRCTWTLNLTSASWATVILDFSSQLATGDVIEIYSCTTSDCKSTSLLDTCTSSSLFCMASTQTGQKPILQVRFQGGTSGTASSFTLSYSSDATVHCPENGCIFHCSASTADACTSLSTCQLQQSSSLLWTPRSCLCFWEYSGSGAGPSQPDYQTNGACAALILFKNGNSSGYSGSFKLKIKFENSSGFAVSQNSVGVVNCSEKDCNAHCNASTADACINLPACQLQQSSSSTSTSVSCYCAWRYRGNGEPHSRCGTMDDEDGIRWAQVAVIVIPIVIDVVICVIVVVICVIVICEKAPQRGAFSRLPDQELGEAAGSNRCGGAPGRRDPAHPAEARRLGWPGGAGREPAPLPALGPFGAEPAARCAGR